MELPDPLLLGLYLCTRPYIRFFLSLPLSLSTPLCLHPHQPLATQVYVFSSQRCKAFQVHSSNINSKLAHQHGHETIVKWHTEKRIIGTVSQATPFHLSRGVACKPDYL